MSSASETVLTHTNGNTNYVNGTPEPEPEPETALKIIQIQASRPGNACPWVRVKYQGYSTSDWVYISDESNDGLWNWDDNKEEGPIYTFELGPLQPPLPTSTPSHMYNPSLAINLLHRIVQPFLITELAPNVNSLHSIITSSPITAVGCIFFISIRLSM